MEESIIVVIPTDFYPNTEENMPILYARNREENPILAYETLGPNGIRTFHYNLPESIHLVLAVMKNILPDELVRKVGGYLYSFNYYVETGSMAPKVKVIFP